MEKTYTIKDILSDDDINEMIEMATKDGLDLAQADGIEFGIQYDTSNGNTDTVNDYKKRLLDDKLSPSDNAIIDKYKAL